VVKVRTRGAVGFVAGAEHRSFEELYRLHSREARRLAYLLTGSQELADDLTQDAFIRAYGRLAHLRSEDSFAPYLRRTVVNLARMQFRRRAVERRYLARQPVEPSVVHQDSEPDDKLQTALAGLPYRHRAAVVLRFYADLPDDEIAEVLGCTTGTVRSLISRGVAGLRTALGGEGRG
jgi:RNA polymerase sigma-70 factor (sigma-E family)